MGEKQHILIKTTKKQHTHSDFFLENSVCCFLLMSSLIIFDRKFCWRCNDVCNDRFFLNLVLIYGNVLKSWFDVFCLAENCCWLHTAVMKFSLGKMFFLRLLCGVFETFWWIFGSVKVQKFVMYLTLYRTSAQKAISLKISKNSYEVSKKS